MDVSGNNKVGSLPTGVWRDEKGTIHNDYG